MCCFWQDIAFQWIQAKLAALVQPWPFATWLLKRLRQMNVAWVILQTWSQIAILWSRLVMYCAGSQSASDTNRRDGFMLRAFSPNLCENCLLLSCQEKSPEVLHELNSTVTNAYGDLEMAEQETLNSEEKWRLKEKGRAEISVWRESGGNQKKWKQSV